MNGITVLNEYSKTHFNVFFIIFIAIAAIVFLICTIVSFSDMEAGSGIFSAICFLLLTLTFIIMITNNSLDYYKDVLIDDNISFTELYEKYEVVGKDGDIYHLKVKGVESND